MFTIIEVLTFSCCLSFSRLSDLKAALHSALCHHVEDRGAYLRPSGFICQCPPQSHGKSLKDVRSRSKNHDAPGSVVVIDVPQPTRRYITNLVAAINLWIFNL